MHRKRQIKGKLSKRIGSELAGHLCSCVKSKATSLHSLQFQVSALESFKKVVVRTFPTISKLRLLDSLLREETVYTSTQILKDPICFPANQPPVNPRSGDGATLWLFKETNVQLEKMNTQNSQCGASKSSTSGSCRAGCSERASPCFSVQF